MYPIFPPWNVLLNSLFSCIFENVREFIFSKRDNSKGKMWRVGICEFDEHINEWVFIRKAKSQLNMNKKVNIKKGRLSYLFP